MINDVPIARVNDILFSARAGFIIASRSGHIFYGSDWQRLISILCFELRYPPCWKAPNGLQAIWLSTRSVVCAIPGKRDNICVVLCFPLWALTLVLPVQLSKEAVSASSSQIPTPISTAPTVPSTLALKYATLASFSWDQDDEKVKVRMKLNAE